MNKVGVIGSGNWGTTVAHLLGLNGHDVVLCTRNSEVLYEMNEYHTNKKYTGSFQLSPKIKATHNFKEVTDNCSIIFVIVPSKVFREVVFELGNTVTGDQILVSGTKGIERGTCKTMSDILKEESSCKKVGALSGPNIANELLSGQPGGAVIGSHYEEVIHDVIDLFSSGSASHPSFKVYGSKDLKGVELGGALKNIIAIGSGIATGLGLQTNSKSFLVTRGLSEMTRLGVFLGAQKETFLGLSGMGDLVTTCFSTLSRNNTFGRLLSQGKSKEDILKEIGMVVEGVYTTEVAYEIARKFQISMPITEGLYKILFEGASVELVLKELLKFDVTYEDEGYKTVFTEAKHLLVNKFPTPEYLF